jgi:hypothetical protein
MAESRKGGYKASTGAGLGTPNPGCWLAAEELDSLLVPPLPMSANGAMRIYGGGIPPPKEAPGPCCCPFSKVEGCI